MKPILIHIPLEPGKSFVAKTIQTPTFEKDWHMHEAYELIFFKKGNGLANIGNYECIYKPWDTFLVGGNLPHRFQPTDNTTEAIIVQFEEACFGRDFTNLPECLPLKQLFQIALHGIQVTDKIRNKLRPLLTAIQFKSEVTRIILLLQCLKTLASGNKEYMTLNKPKTNPTTYSQEDSIAKIIKYTNSSFHEPVTLSQAAALACKSIPAFCYYFKRATQKTYIHYLNEVRIAHACNQLLQTNKPVVDIGYESGYNTVAHFHRQFFRLKKTTPLQYRKLFSSSYHSAVQTKQ